MKTIFLLKEKRHLPEHSIRNWFRELKNDKFELFEIGKGWKKLPQSKFKFDTIPDFGEWDEITGFERLREYAEKYGDECALASLPRNANIWQEAVLAISKNSKTITTSKNFKWFYDTFGVSALKYADSLMFCACGTFSFDIIKFSEQFLKVPENESCSDVMTKRYGIDVTKKFEEIFFGEK